MPYATILLARSRDKCPATVRDIIFLSIQQVLTNRALVAVLLRTQAERLEVTGRLGKY